MVPEENHNTDVHLTTTDYQGIVVLMLNRFCNFTVLLPLTDVYHLTDVLSLKVSHYPACYHESPTLLSLKV